MHSYHVCGRKRGLRVDVCVRFHCIDLSITRAQGHILDSPEERDLREGRRLELSPNWNQLSYRPRAPGAIIPGLQQNHAREVCCCL
jgi:hypothetical protein